MKTLIGRLWQGWCKIPPDVVLVLISLSVFFTFKEATLYAKTFGLNAVLLPPILAIGLCLVFPGPRHTEVAPALKIIVRVIGTLLGLYSVVAVVTFPAGVSSSADTQIWILQLLSVVALLAAIATFFRPAFVIIPAATIMSKKASSELLFGIRISHTDYIPVVEMGLFLGLGTIVLGFATSGQGRRWLRDTSVPDLVWSTTLLFIVAVGVHFSNYFYSGLQKLLMDDVVWTWPLENPTYVLSISAWISGLLPISHIDWLAAQVITSTKQMNLVLNASILLCQIASVVLIARRWAMIGLTMFYDLTHVVIFLVSGIFFWKWIILNLGLVVAMRSLPRRIEARTPALMAMCSVLLAPLVFSVVWLGWFDTPALTRSETFAVTTDGQRVRVPTNYFGTISITAAQHRFGRVSDNHFPTVTFGSTQSPEIFRDALDNCQFNDGYRQRFQQTEAYIARLVRLTHEYAAQQAGPDGRYAYDSYPHHIWSNPMMHKDFAELAVEEIDHYIYRSVSGCVSLRKGQPVVDERYAEEFRIDL